jgi:hypothetical protein
MKATPATQPPQPTTAALNVLAAIVSAARKDVDPANRQEARNESRHADPIHFPHRQ